VTVWRIGLDAGEAVADRLRPHLSGDEVERLARMPRSEVGRRWLISRGALREVLAAELGISPAAVQLELGAHGRPRLDRAAHRTDMDFNLSHSGDLALLAIAREMRLGVDVERLRRGRDPLRIASRYFSSAEVAALRAVPAEDRAVAFLRYWTAREAIAKGLGLGLRTPGKDLELTAAPDGTLRPARAAPEWQLVEVKELPVGYCGTLAIDRPAQVAVRDWAAGREVARARGK
jgi:4'-phosphopantetheinyl transferase